MGGDSSELTIVVKARDQASAIIDKVKSAVGEGLPAAMQRAQKGSEMLAVGLAAVGTATLGVGAAAVSSASDYEQQRVAFETMLGSADRARQLMTEIAQFAKETPFELPQVVEGSKQLLAFGFAQEQIIPTMRQLGDLAAGLGVPIGQLTTVYGQVRVAGRLMGQDLLQFTNAGVPLIEALATTLHKPQSEIKDLVEQGKIGFPQVQDAITSLTGEGSKFGGMMEKQSHTLSGVWSNIKDGFGQALRSMIGITVAGDVVQGGLFDKIKSGAERLMPIVQNLPQELANGFKMIKPYIPEIAGAILVGLVPAFMAWATAAWAAIAPLLPFIAAGAVLGALIKFIVDKMGGWSQAWEKLHAAITPVANIIVGVLKPAFSALWNTIENTLWPALKKLGNFLQPVLKPALIILAALILGPLAAAIAVFVGGIWLVTNAINIAIQVADWLFHNVIVPGVNIAVTVFQTLWSIVSTVFNAISTVVSTTVNILVSVFMVFFNFYSFVFQTIYAIAVWVWQAIYNAAVKPVIDAISIAVDWMGNVVSSVFSAIWGVAQPIFSAIGGAASDAWHAVVGVWQTAGDWFRGVFKDIGNAASSVAGSIGGFFSGAWDDMKSGFKSAVNWVVDLANKFIGAYNNSVGKVPGAPDISKIPKFAKGVDNFQGGFAVTGENGPEIGWWPRGTNIMSNNDLKQALAGAGSGSGGGDNIHIEFSGPVNMRDEAEATSIAGILAQQLRAARAGSY